MDTRDFRETARVAVLRAAQSDFLRNRATDAERAQLGAAATPVRGALVQDYAVWRRAMLWLAASALIVHTLVGMVTFTSMETVMVDAQMQPGVDEGRLRAQVRHAFGEDNLQTLDVLQMLLLVASALGSGLVCWAAVRWLDVRQSRRLARVGWLVMFAVPMLLALMPWARMMEFPNMDASQREMVSATIGLALGMSFFVIVAPKAVALFPGAIRASLTLKTLLPENPMPGWVAALIAPLYSVFLLVIIVTINQLQGDFLLVIGVVLLMLGPLVNVRRARDLLRAHTPEEAGRLVADVRRTSGTFAVLGLVFLVAFIVKAELFSVGDAIGFVFAMVGSVLLLTLVSADFFVALLHANHTQAKEFLASDLAGRLDARFDELAGSGLADWGGSREAADVGAGS